MKKLFRRSIILVILYLGYLSCQSQFLLDNEIRSIQKSGFLISELPDFSAVDWSGIDEMVRGKRVIVLGEFTHGAQEVFEMQNSAVKYLHERHGFDVVLFESGLAELIELNLHKNDLSPEQLTEGFFGGWRNQSHKDLMSFLKNEQMEFAGFDVQRFGSSFFTTLGEVGLLTGVTDSSLNELETGFGDISNRFRSESYEQLAPETLQLIQKWEALIEQMESTAVDPIIVQAVRNRIGYLSYYLDFIRDKDWNRRFEARDSIMAENVNWLMENQFQSQRVIILTHNYHASRHNDKIQTMGQFLNQQFGTESLVIGTYALHGNYNGNSGSPNTIVPPDSTRLDLKHIIKTLPGYARLLDIHDLRVMNQPIIVNDTFLDLYNSNKTNLSNHFDALILLKEVSPPLK